jgi:tRNA(fMet)-specific endonuclease VapC
MTLRYLLNTNIVNDALKHHTIAISALTRAELRFGQAGMQADDKRRSFIDHFLVRLPNLVWTNTAADHYGDIKVKFKRQDLPTGDMDTLIAAHALADNLILVTQNTRHFEQVPGLQVEDWVAVKSKQLLA